MRFLISVEENVWRDRNVHADCRSGDSIVGVCLLRVRVMKDSL
jgi:hypothetical protein